MEMRCLSAHEQDLLGATPGCSLGQRRAQCFQDCGGCKELVTTVARRHLIDQSAADVTQVKIAFTAVLPAALERGTACEAPRLIQG
eukprot:10758237-Alexandrium_andersonii.AAC.1